MWNAAEMFDDLARASGSVEPGRHALHTRNRTEQSASATANIHEYSERLIGEAHAGIRS